VGLVPRIPEQEQGLSALALLHGSTTAARTPSLARSQPSSLPFLVEVDWLTDRTELTPTQTELLSARLPLSSSPPLLAEREGRQAGIPIRGGVGVEAGQVRHDPPARIPSNFSASVGANLSRSSRLFCCCCMR